MLARSKGTTIVAICDKTGWQRHTVHAFLSGLRKLGSTIEHDGRGKDASYRLTLSQGLSNDPPEGFSGHGSR